MKKNLPFLSLKTGSKLLPDNFPVFWKNPRIDTWYFQSRKIQDRPQKYLMASWT